MDQIPAKILATQTEDLVISYHIITECYNQEDHALS